MNLLGKLKALTRMETWLLSVEQMLYEYPLSKGEVGEMKTLMERLKVFVFLFRSSSIWWIIEDIYGESAATRLLRQQIFIFQLLNWFFRFVKRLAIISIAFQRRLNQLLVITIQIQYV